MKRPAIIVFVLASAGLAALSLGGPLNPPAGAVSATGKTTQEIYDKAAAAEPRIAINAANTPGDADSVFKITQRGSYYLTASISGPSGKHGIEVAANGVTIDLNGFEVNGQTGSLDGIHSDAAISVVVRNGKVQFWGQSGINFGSSSDISIEHVTSSNNAATGIHVGLGSKVLDCTVQSNANGITVDGRGLVRGCTSLANDFDGIRVEFESVVRECVSSNNGDDGIEATSNCRVCDNTLISNGPAASGAGIYVTGSGTAVTDNQCNGNHFGVLTANLSNGAIVLRNIATANTNNFSLGGAPLAGPIVTPATMGTNTNPAANYSR